MKIKLGRRSKKNLCKNLDYRLVHIVCEVIRRYKFEHDWGVFETRRSLEQQKLNIKKGVSKTLNSKHIPNKYNIVRAMDIVPYVNGMYSWENAYFKPIIDKFKIVANEIYPGEIEFGYDWGWDKPHIQIKNGHDIY